MKTMDFLQTVCGENDIEFRLIEEGGSGRKLCYSIFKHGNRLYSSPHNRESGSHYNEINLNHALLLRDYYPWYDSEYFGIFFIPNSPDYKKMQSFTCKDKDIVRFNCQFIDIDCKDKEIMSDKLKRKQWKLEKVEKLKSHAARPTIIVDTKNGLHCYWLIKDGKKELFRQVQLQLIKEFGGDPKCVNESRPLRLVGYFHRKDHNSPYPVHAFDYYNKRYTQEELQGLLPKLSVRDIRNSIKSQRENKPLDIDEGLKKNLISLLLEKLKCTKNDARKIVCHCPMPDHQDNNPSAWFDKDYLWLHCSGCGTQIPLEELAEELGWDDILQELDKMKYHLVVKPLYDKINKQMVNIKDYPELVLLPEDEIIHSRIVEKVIQEFEGREQKLNEIHKQYISDIVQILLKGKPSIHPDLIPLDIGGGKSTILEIFLSEMLKVDPNYGCIVVKERKVDVRSLAQSINDRVGRKVAYPMYGFEECECLEGRKKCNIIRDDSDYDDLKTYTKCSSKTDCRYACQNNEQAKFPIVVITHQKLHLLKQKESIDNISCFKGNDIEYKRDKLFIDEKPKLVEYKQYNAKLFNLCKNQIVNDLEYVNVALIPEFEEAIQLVESYFDSDAKERFTGRQSINPIDPNFRFSEEFKTHFNHYFVESVEVVFNFPDFVETIITKGGHWEVKNKKYTVSTSFYCPNNYGEQFHTVIFDGTADIDLSYKHEHYRVFDFKPIRTYENFTIFQCDYLKSSRRQMSNEKMIDAFCEQVKDIAESNPESNIYVPVFSDHEKQIKNLLVDYIEKGKIKVDHFGGTKGKNEYLDCDITVVEGILHKTEDYYIALQRAISAQHKEDLDCSYKGICRRFNDAEIETIKVADMNCDYAQEIKRSSQRDNTKNVEGQIYIFTNDTVLLDILPLKFPGSQVEKWNPMKIIENNIFNRRHKQAKNDKIICDFFISGSTRLKITQEEIIEHTKLDKGVVSKILKKKQVAAFINELGFGRFKQGKHIVFIQGDEKNNS